MSWAERKDQAAVADLLQRSLRRGRLAQAYLFSGPRGSGKETLARTLAKALNCLEKEHDSCDRCDSCRRIDAGVPPDIYWVRPESKTRRILIEQIREFEQAVYLKPTLARVKVGVIVDADCMGDEAGNAFLKTLEEPPSQTVILLLSAEPQRLLPTTLSRCLRIAFAGAGPRAALAYRDRVLPRLAQFRSRGPSRVTATYELLAALTGLLQEIREEVRQRVEADAGLDRYAELEPKARERLEAQVAARIEGEYRAAREQVLEGLYGWFSDVLLCVEGVDPDLLEHRDQLPSARQAAAGLTYPQAEANLHAVEQIRESLTRNIPEPLALEVGLLKLTV